MTLPNIRNLLIVLTFLLPPAHLLADTSFSRIVCFGDGLSDSGNLCQLTGGAFPSAPTGPQSNGPVWVEYLARRLNLAVSNYAVIGAMTGTGPDSPTGNVWSDTFPNLSGTDISSQLQDYLRDNQGSADPAALYILEGGANDLPLLTNPIQTLLNLVWTFMKLQQSGARHVVIVLLPDLGTTYPIAIAEQYALLPPGAAANYSSICIAINAALREAMSALTAPGVTVTFADFARFCEDVTADPSAYGMAEARLPYSRATAGHDPGTFLFWDDYHPTTRAHELFATQALNSLLARYSGQPIAVPPLKTGP